MSNKTKSKISQATPDDCETCLLSNELSDKESWILQEMRSIKEQVRPIADRLNELEKRIKQPTLDQTQDDRNAEWAKLEGQMADLRKEWQIWQGRLDEAIEQKLICLGHRAPK